MYEITFYTTKRGDSPIDDFLNKLDKKSLAKAQAYIALLAEMGPVLKRPYADHVRGKIRELRIHYSSNQYRILYFFYLRNQVILVHAFAKKAQQLPEGDIRLAEQRMDDWIKRESTGG